MNLSIASIRWKWSTFLPIFRSVSLISDSSSSEFIGGTFSPLKPGGANSAGRTLLVKIQAFLADGTRSYLTSIRH